MSQDLFGYTVSGTRLETGGLLGGITDYCVEGSILHLMERASMDMGAMGQVLIARDIVARRQ